MKKVVVFASLNEEGLSLLKSLKHKDILKNAEVHFYHCFEIHIYTTDLSPYIFPVEEQYPAIEASTIKILKNVASEILDPEDLKHAVFKCEFSQMTKQKSIEYLEEIKATYAVATTRGKHGIEGFFTSSFAEHLMKFSPCDVYITRDHSE